jgi:formylglycine-generating enzyme
MRARAIVVVSVLAAASACASIVGIDSLEVGECKGGPPCAPGIGSDGGVDASADDAFVPPNDSGGGDSGLPCPGTAGPTMLRVGAATNSFCIDTTEVTVAQYKAFLAAKGGDVTGQPVECAWNATYAPGFSGTDEIPQTGVDWCDARAFCAWSGKHLCGKVVGGKAVGAIADSELGNIEVHAWFVACTAQGQLRYPYGSLLRAGACNLLDADAGKTLPVRTMTGCQGGYPGLYDMVGNVWEWFDGPTYPPDAGPGVDAGASPQRDQVLAKDGSFSTAGTIDCRGDGRGGTRDLRAADIGFRCCAE